ncbi:MAG TPA: zinc-binding dehydrogenase [Opitutus sp.]|nr:zinc-binding dehydrogenase [Opitutus sp.]
MRAVHIAGINDLTVSEVPAPTAAPGEAVVSIKTAALNHRDVWIMRGQYAGLKYPCIPGSDGAGIVTAVGERVDPAWIGREVIINPSFNWGTNERVQGPNFSILGLPRDGTLAEQISVPVEQLAEKPRNLSWEQAAAVPLAGLTGWRALVSRAQLQPKEKVLITGIGGGVALFVLQFAVAHGAEVWVTSSLDAKIQRAVQLGAKGGAIYTERNWAAKLAKAAGGFDVVIDSAGGAEFESLIGLVADGGRVVFFGATRGNPPMLPMTKIFWRQITLLGTTMGSPADWEAMRSFLARTQIQPVVSEVFPLARAGEAFALMDRGGQFGKIVLQVS